MKDQPTRVTVHCARYSLFDPDRWWETHDAVRIELQELEKLLLDVSAPPDLLKHLWRPKRLSLRTAGAAYYTTKNASFKKCDHRSHKKRPQAPLPRKSLRPILEQLLRLLPSETKLREGLRKLLEGVTEASPERLYSMLRPEQTEITWPPCLNTHSQLTSKQDHQLLSKLPVRWQRTEAAIRECLRSLRSNIHSRGNSCPKQSLHRSMFDPRKPPDR